MKFLVRTTFTNDGKPSYLKPSGGWARPREEAWQFDSKAKAWAEGRATCLPELSVVPLLSHEEAKRKFAAEQMRAIADQFEWHGSGEFEVGRMRQYADALWPAKATGGAR